MSAGFVDSKMNLVELKRTGWTRVDGVSSPAELLELGRVLGTPIPSPNGEMVKEIRVTPAAEGLPGSQSALHGRGRFPLHTDTVFWPLPVRYVLLRGSGDTRRPTTVLSFARLLGECDKRIGLLAEKSIWLAGAKVKPFYCSLRFRQDGVIGWRYDPDNMSPVNEAAAEVDRAIRPVANGPLGDAIHWSGDCAVVLSNWHVLHGRGPEPLDEGARVVERLYVR
jgi:hypothetical protein